jgi:hypothetical protein
LCNFEKGNFIKVFNQLCINCNTAILAIYNDEIDKIQECKTLNCMKNIYDQIVKIYNLLNKTEDIEKKILAICNAENMIDIHIKIVIGKIKSILSIIQLSCLGVNTLYDDISNFSENKPLKNLYIFKKILLNGTICSHKNILNNQQSQNQEPKLFIDSTLKQINQQKQSTKFNLDIKPNRTHIKYKDKSYSIKYDILYDLIFIWFTLMICLAVC